MIRLGIFVNKDKDKDFLVTNELIEVSKSFGAECEVAKKGGNYDFIISLGGDGTFLAATREFLSVPIFGINLGHLGFLSEASKGDAKEVVYDLINGRYKIEERFLLETNINGKRLLALNDIVINRSNEKTRLLDLNLSFDGKYIDNYMADGVIISTPTGSTAYSLSAGGPIIEPDLDVVVVTPICAHSLHQRPIIVDSNTLISAKSKINSLMITADGQVLVKGDDVFEINIKRADKKARIVKLTDRCFFDIVREKFHLN